MALMTNGKEVDALALGGNEYLSVENLNAFYIDETKYDSNAIYTSLTIDMTNYFKEADTKHPDVQYYQIMAVLDYKDNDDTIFRANLITPLLKRGKINNKWSVAAGDGQSVVAWFKDQNTLAISTTSMYDEGAYAFTGWFAYVYGFTSQI